jgi:inorganic pyrophosphatase/exopolyphosphatase
MEQTIQAVYSWKGIKNDIRDFLRTCEYCQTKKPYTGAKPLKPIISSAKRERIVFDLTEISQKKDQLGKRYILVCIDHFTKWIWTKAFPKKTSKPISDW